MKRGASFHHVYVVLAGFASGVTAKTAVVILPVNPLSFRSSNAYTLEVVQNPI